MIDKRELLEKARSRNLNLQIIEKDYVLGWLLFGLRGFNDLAFKGGTALAKVYFPQTWRLSEDLDFVFQGENFEAIIESLGDIFPELRKKSGIKFEIKSQFSNPQYLQLKIRYDAIIGKNWAKVDVTKEWPLDAVHHKPLSRTYSDYPDFAVKVESLEEIFAEKLRALLERKKSRDYYDIWRLCSTDFQKEKIKNLFEKKRKLNAVEFVGTNQFFPEDIFGILQPYWERELGRLLSPLPDLNEVLAELKDKIGFLKP
ncbi:nucleotidyl transferase AbiEii/AbiGii toxin family protein [candidate division KSB1 bacterium]|nr:nucleotidyl transferase AbiEii/AbiGii toxin family protein [candidate division KSB1 bacterium]